MKKILLSSTILLLLSINCVFAQLSESDFNNLFDQWNAALQTGEPAKVAALYSEEAVLLPTVSNKVRFGHKDIEAYFVDFLKYKPKGKILPEHRFFKAFSDKAGVDAGVYEFELVKDGKTEKVKARYTFIYEKINGQWLITVHHSSAMPQATQQPEVVEVVEEVSI